MARINAAHVTFRPANGKPVGGPWRIHPLPFEGDKDASVITLGTDGQGGTWAIEPAPFIVTHDPNPPETFVTVYDSTTIGTIGRIAASSKETVAAYNDGLFDNLAEARKAYPNHHVQSICVKFGDRADWADTEEGNMSPQAALNAFIQGLVRGIYASLDTWNNQLVPHLGGRKPLRWVADWTGVPHLPRLADGVEADACQYNDHTAGRTNTDISLFKSSAL